MFGTVIFRTLLCPYPACLVLVLFGYVIVRLSFVSSTSSITIFCRTVVSVKLNSNCAPSIGSLGAQDGCADELEHTVRNSTTSSLCATRTFPNGMQFSPGFPGAPEDPIPGPPQASFGDPRSRSRIGGLAESRTALIPVALSFKRVVSRVKPLPSVTGNPTGVLKKAIGASKRQPGVGLGNGTAAHICMSKIHDTKIIAVDIAESVSGSPRARRWG